MTSLGRTHVGVVLATLTACAGPTVPDGGDAGPLDAHDAARADAAADDATPPVPTLVSVANLAAAGARDPSLTLGPDGRFWLSFTESAASAATPANDALSIALASSTDGRSFAFDAIAVASMDLGAGQTLEQTHSRVVFDPWSPPGSQWHLFWDRHVTAPGAPSAHAWVQHRVAASPSPFTGPDEKLFVGAAYDPADDATGGPARVDLSTLAPDLATCDTPHDPGVVVAADGWYVALTCDAHLPMAGRVAMLFRARADGAWRDLGTLATDLDSTLLGYPHFTASELAMVGSTMYLLLSPVDAAGDTWGCVSYWVLDPRHGALWREDGPPGDVLGVRGDVARPSGSCAYEATAPLGMLYAENLGTAPDQWRLFASHQFLPPHP